MPIVAVAVLALNDRVLKHDFGNALTGKLSDVAGLVFLPLLMVAIVELSRSVRHVEWRASARTLGVSLVSVGLVFACAKVSPAIAHLCGDLLGYVRYPVRRSFERVTITHDVSDLVALPALLFAWFDGSRAIRLRRFASHRRPCTQTSGHAVQP